MQTARVAEVSQLLPHPAPHKQQLIPLMCAFFEPDITIAVDVPLEHL